MMAGDLGNGQGDRAAWAAYAERLARLLGLGEWRIIVEATVASDGVSAEVAVVRGRRIAHIRLAVDWAGFTPEEQREAITHELLHLYTEPLLAMVDAASEALKPKVHRVLRGQMDLAAEYAVDALAVAIAERLPLFDDREDDADAATGIA